MTKLPEGKWMNKWAKSATYEKLINKVQSNEQLWDISTAWENRLFFISKIPAINTENT